MRMKQKKPNTVFADIRKNDPERYAAMQAKAKASGRLSMGRPHCTPDGFTARVVKATHKKAKVLAKERLKKMEEKGLITADEAAANKALEKALQILSLNDSIPEDHPNRLLVSHDVELKAAKLILEFTKAKPMIKSEVTVHSAEDFLKNLLAEDADGQE